MIKFVNDHLDNIHGQNEYRLTATDDVQILGFIDYSEYKNDVGIKMIKAFVKRQKIGTLMVQHLQKLYPDTEIGFGMLTDEGSLLYNSLEKKEVPNGRWFKTHELKDKLEAILNDLQKKYDDLEQQEEPMLLRDFFSKYCDRWTTLHNRYDMLVRHIDNHPKYKTIIDY